MFRKLLLVDDDRNVWRVLKCPLEREGYEVLFASGGDEAMEIISQKNIDLIIMDIDLKEQLDGIELAKNIHAKIDIPLIFLTSHTESAVVKRAEQVSSYGYVIKDNGTAALIYAINMAFRLHDSYEKLKKQEFETSEKERILSITQSILGMGNFTADIRTQKWQSSHVLEEIYGIDQNFEKSFENWLCLITPDHREEVRKEFNSCIENKKRFDYIYKVIRPSDNKECWVHSVGDFDKRDGNLMIGTVLNITKKKNFEMAFAESETNYRTLLNASPEGIIVMDLKGKITDVSTIAIELFGEIRESEIIGRNFYEYLEPSEVSGFLNLMKSTVAEGVIQNVEKRLRRRNSITFPCELSTTLIQDKSGKSKAFMAVIRDISERKKLEQQLIHSERMISLGEMAAGIAHEINQPLNNISLSLENILFMLNSGEMNKKYISAKTANIFDGISRIESIIDYIRAYSRKQDDVISAPFDINNCIRFASMLISEQLQKGEIDLEFDLASEPVIIMGNTFKFEQMLLNLLSNARDAIEEKQRMHPGIERKIIIKSWKKDGTYRIKISDTGIGIPKENLNKIMLPFFTTKPLGKGTGLGLSMVYKILNEMNGRIEISGRETGGTDIMLSVPFINMKKDNGER